MRNKVRFLTDYGKRRLLSRYGIIYDKTTRNVLRVHNRNESWGHFLTKAVLFKLFRDKGYDVIMEAETANGVIDIFVFDLELAIEVMSTPHPRRIAHTRETYKELKEIVIVAVPQAELSEFCQLIQNQVHIWL